MIDLHFHRKDSHGNHLEPENWIEKATPAKLDGFCFTERYSFDSSWPVERMKLPEIFWCLAAWKSQHTVVIFSCTASRMIPGITGE